MVSIPKASHRKREIAFDPRLAVALAAGSLMRPRQALRPYAMIERQRDQTGFSATSYNSASLTQRLAYTNGGDKIARVAGRRANQGAGAGGPGGPGPGGGSWP